MVKNRFGSYVFNVGLSESVLGLLFGLVEDDGVSTGYQFLFGLGEVLRSVVDSLDQVYPQKFFDFSVVKSEGRIVFETFFKGCSSEEFDFSSSADFDYKVLFNLCFHELFNGVNVNVSDLLYKVDGLKRRLVKHFNGLLSYKVLFNARKKMNFIDFNVGESELLGYSLLLKRDFDSKLIADFLVGLQLFIDFFCKGFHYLSVFTGSEEVSGLVHFLNDTKISSGFLSYII